MIMTILEGFSKLKLLKATLKVMWEVFNVFEKSFKDDKKLQNYTIPTFP